MLNTESSAPRLGLGNHDHSDVEGQMDFRGESRMGCRDWERAKIRWEAIRLCSHDRSAWLQRSRLQILGNCPEARTKTRRRTRTVGRPCIVACLEGCMALHADLVPVSKTDWRRYGNDPFSFQTVGSSRIHQVQRHFPSWAENRGSDPEPFAFASAGHIWHHALSQSDYPWRWAFRSTKWPNDQSMSGSLSKRNRRSAHGGPGSGSPWQRSRSKPWQGPGKLWMILSSTVALPGISEISVIWYRAMMGYASSSISILNCDGDFGWEFQ